MLRRSLLVSALLLAGSFGFAGRGSAQAVNEPVDFTGTVPTSCLLTTPTDGLLGVNGDNTVLSSTIAGGTAATIDIDCDGGDLIVTAPALTNAVPAVAGGPTTADGDFTKTARITTLNNNQTVNSGAAAITLSAADNGIATVNMEATAATAIEPGDYTFTVTVTATP
jgi:hypothetical protein